MSYDKQAMRDWIESMLAEDSSSDQRTVTFSVFPDRTDEAEDVLQDMGYVTYFQRPIRLCAVRMDQESTWEEKVEFMAPVHKDHIDDLVRELSDRKLSAYSRKTQLRVFPDYEWRKIQ